MVDKSSFDSNHIKATALSRSGDLLDHFNLPPVLADFLRKNQRIIWLVTGCIAVVVTGVAIFNGYREYRSEKAASTLTMALQADDAHKAEMLNQIVRDYASTSSALWSRVELAQLAVRQGKSDEAISQFVFLEDQVSAKNPLKPLVLQNLGMLYENGKDFTKALEAYKKLAGFSSFEAAACQAMGLIYEQQGNKEQARAMYEKYISLIGDEKGGADPYRAIVQARLSRLQK